MIDQADRKVTPALRIPGRRRWPDAGPCGGYGRLELVALCTFHVPAMSPAAGRSPAISACGGGDLAQSGELVLGDAVALRDLTTVVINQVEWREGAAQGERGQAVIRPFPTPQGIRENWPVPEKERPDEPALIGGSSGRPEWLPRHDSNMRPGD